MREKGEGRGLGGKRGGRAKGEREEGKMRETQDVVGQLELGLWKRSLSVPERRGGRRGRTAM